MKKKLGIFFMIAGIICLTAAIVLLTYNNIENENSKKASSAVMVSIKSSIEANEPAPYDEDPFDTEMLTVNIDGYDYIGYLSIPRIELELPVMSEWDYSRLKIAACRYYGSTKTDNLVIAAHNYSSQFGYLGNLTEDDVVMFTDMENENHTYKVTLVELLQPQETDRVKDTGDDLILYTCNYRGDARITVRCSRVDSQ